MTGKPLPWTEAAGAIACAADPRSDGAGRARPLPVGHLVRALRRASRSEQPLDARSGHSSRITSRCWAVGVRADQFMDHNCGQP